MLFLKKKIELHILVWHVADAEIKHLPSLRLQNLQGKGAIPEAMAMKDLTLGEMEQTNGPRLGEFGCEGVREEVAFRYAQH